MDPIVLGVDLGTSSIKVLALTFDGAVVAESSANYSTLHPQPGHAEQSPASWAKATESAIRSITTQKNYGQRVVAIGITGQMHGTVLLDEDRKPVRPAIIWMDQRSADDVTAMTASIGQDRLASIGGSSLATGFQSATVRWVARQEPTIWSQVAHVLTPKDWLRFHLTGEFKTDPSDASGTLLFDVTRRIWSPELMDAAGVRLDQLPEVLPSQAVGGQLRPDLANEFGLPASIPIIVGAGDTPAAAVGAGIVDQRVMMLSLSTGTQQYIPAEAPNVDPSGRIHTWCSALEPSSGPGWYQMSATLNGGSAVRWLSRNVLNLQGPSADTDLFALASQSSPGANGLLFVPYLGGERSPLFDSGARGAFIGLTDRHDQADLARAVIEGVTLAAADAFASLRDAGVNPEIVVAVGGGAKSPFWTQIAANIFQLPVRGSVVADQSARGAALLAAASTSGTSVTALARKWTDLGTTFEPDTTVASLYRERLETLRRLHTAIRPHLPETS